MLTEPPHRHGTAPRTGVLIVNLGSPDAPAPQALRTYLREFLSDRYVIEIPRPLWWLILNGFILVTRPRASAARYAQVWMNEGAPLKVHTARQATILRGHLGERVKHPVIVDYAMRYGSPAIEAKLVEMKAHGCDRILVVPLYPQYAASTTGTAFAAVFAAVARMRSMPALRMVRHFHDDEGYIRALAQSVRDYWMRHGRPDRLVISFHGVPRLTLERGDPYHCECRKTARLLAEALQLEPEQFEVAFQSRFGRAEWLKPYTADVLQALGKQKIGRADVICPGFVADCLETLEEIGIEGRRIFLGAGGREFHCIPCLNEREDWMKALTDLVARNLLGWTTAVSGETLEMSRLRATAMGAKH